MGARAVDMVELVPGRWMVVERGEEWRERKRFRWMVEAIEDEEWIESAEEQVSDVELGGH